MAEYAKYEYDERGRAFVDKGNGFTYIKFRYINKLVYEHDYEDVVKFERLNEKLTEEKIKENLEKSIKKEKRSKTIVSDINKILKSEQTMKNTEKLAKIDEIMNTSSDQVLNNIDDIDDSFYYNSDAISQSDLKVFIKNREHYLYCKTNKINKETEAFVFGKAYHCYMLEPNKFNQIYTFATNTVPQGKMGEFIKSLVENSDEENAFDIAYSLSGFEISKERVLKSLSEDKNKSVYEYLLKNKNKQILSFEQKDQLDKMRDNLIANDYSNNFLFMYSGKNVDSYIEKPIFWYCPEVPSIGLRSKPDKFIVDGDTIFIIDIKSTDDNSLEEFKRSIRKYRYDIQASFYAEAVKYFYKENYSDFNKFSIYDMKFRFIFIVQSKKAPYSLLGILELSDEILGFAKEEWVRSLKIMEICKQTGDYSYCNNMNIIEENHEVDEHGIKTIRLI